MYLKKRLETIFHNAIRKTGYDVVKSKYSKHELEIEQLLTYHGVDTVLDVGANKGQYGKYLRIGGYRNQIISFEPLNDAFVKLEELSRKDKFWQVHQMALGDFDGTSEINISGNSVSSSFRNINATHIESAPASKYIGKQEIEVHKLDTIYKDFRLENKKIFMKIDTQGFEKNVLSGANESLKNIDMLQLEMSVQPLYDGEDLYYQLSEFLYQKGYRLIKLVRGLTKDNGELLQFDGVFKRSR